MTTYHFSDRDDYGLPTDFSTEDEIMRTIATDPDPQGEEKERCDQWIKKRVAAVRESHVVIPGPSTPEVIEARREYMGWNNKTPRPRVPTWAQKKRDQSRKRLGPTTIQQIRTAKELGFSIKSIAILYKINKKTVARYLKNA